jgi:hypothetical protein
MPWADRARRTRRQRGRTVSNRRAFRLAGSFLSAFALLLQGCYETLPLEQGAPPAAVSIQLQMNDKGRLDVSQKLGSAVDKVEGMITAQNTDSYTLAVSRVFQLGGATSKWNGESVTIAKDGTNGFQVHRYSQTRTVILAVALVAATVLFLASVKLIGGGADPGTGNGNPGQTH